MSSGFSTGTPFSFCRYRFSRIIRAFSLKFKDWFPLPIIYTSLENSPGSKISLACHSIRFLKPDLLSH